MAGGGVNPENAALFLDAGASHVIVTSYVFSGGVFHEERLTEMIRAVGKKHLVLDLSCRRKAEGERNAYFIVTDRWQNFTDVSLSLPILSDLSAECDEFLIHAVDVEGKQSGIENDLVFLLGSFCEKTRFPVTYAGGVGSFEDLKALERGGRGLLDVTIGSALDLFGGCMSYRELLEFLRD